MDRSRRNWWGKEPPVPNTWSVTALNLAGGDNLFTFIAYDAGNNRDTAKILVTYNEYLNFLGPLMINPAGFYVNTNTIVTFSISILTIRTW